MLIFLESAKHIELVQRAKGVACVIAKHELARYLKGIPGLGVTENPRLSFYKIHNYLAGSSFYWKDFPTRIDKTAKVHSRALIAKKNVLIGAGSIVQANVVIPERCLIGSRVLIMPGVVLGSVGLQVTRFKEGVVDMTHAGGIKIGNRVQIMPNSVIASAVFGQLTTIGEDSRIGNLVFISHNVQVGSGCFVGHGSVINGNIKIGDNVWIGPGTVLSNNIVIGDRARVCLGSTVINNVASQQSVIGSVAMEKSKMLKHLNSIRGKNA